MFWLVLVPGKDARLGETWLEVWIEAARSYASGLKGLIRKTEIKEIKVMIETAQIFTQRLLGEMGVGQYTGARLSPTREEIAQLAYSLYESRGRQDGHDVEDWLRAELEFVHHYA